MNNDSSEPDTCPQCNNSSSKHLFSAKDFDTSTNTFNIQYCEHCALAFTSPSLNPEQLNDYYSLPYYGDSDKKFNNIVENLTRYGNKLRAKEILQAIKNSRDSLEKPIKMLDIGCGRANLLRELHALGCECHGTELSEFPRRKELDGIHFHKYDAHFDDNFFDGVVIWHVLEHIHTPYQTLQNIHRTLKPGGTLALAVPNFSSFQAQLFKRHWFHLDLPRHLFHFKKHPLEHYLIDNGFTINKTSTRSFEQNLFGNIQSTLNSIKYFGKPNSYYQLLKQHNGPKKIWQLIFWSFVAVLILPFALLEVIVTSATGTGASIIIFAQKKP